MRLTLIALLVALIPASAAAQGTPPPDSPRSRCGLQVVIGEFEGRWSWQVQRPDTDSRFRPIENHVSGWNKTETRATRNAHLVADVLGGCR